MNNPAEEHAAAHQAEQRAAAEQRVAAERIADNWRRLVDEVREAATAAGRSPQSVRIVGVSKYVDAATTRHLAAAGCHELGESRPQALWEKADQLTELPIRWHLIGPLQRNKVRRTLPVVDLIHSIDSLRLAEAIDREAAAGGRILRGLLEVNISRDPAKHGFAAEQVPEALEVAGRLANLRITGLMAMASDDRNASTARHNFEDLRALRDRLVQQGPPQHVTLDELSMGMSGDFVEAIAAGSTLVRIGSRLFAGLDALR